jgi:FkbM family methyltransferase
LKNAVKFFLQSTLGFRTYLLVFAKYKVATLRWDKKEKDFFYFLSLLKDDGKSILDIGANIGIMAAHLSKSFPNCQIHAVEPMKDNIDVLNKVLINSSNVLLYEVAVGNEEGEATMILPVQGKTKMQGLSHIKTKEITEWNEGTEYKVPLTKLDNLILADEIQGVKMDVENFEYQALLGAEQIFRKNRPILYVELWDNQNRQNCFELLKSWGFGIYVVEQNRLVEFRPEVHLQQNFIFLPN